MRNPPATLQLERASAKQSLWAGKLRISWQSSLIRTFESASYNNVHNTYHDKRRVWDLSLGFNGFSFWFWILFSLPAAPSGEFCTNPALITAGCQLLLLMWMTLASLCCILECLCNTWGIYLAPQSCTICQPWLVGTKCFLLLEPLFWQNRIYRYIYI